MNTCDYFPTFVHHDFIEQKLSELEVVFDRGIAQEIARREGDKSHDIVQSRDLSHEPLYSSLIEYFYNNSINILDRSGYATEKYEFFVSVWAQRADTGQCHDFHNHIESCMSGIYYITYPEDGSYIEFQDPRPGKNMGSLEIRASEDVHYAHRYIHYKNCITPGTFVIFESWLDHKISRNFSNTPTKFLHFGLHQRRRL